MKVDGQRVTIVKDTVALDGTTNNVVSNRQPFGLEILGSPQAARNVKVCSKDGKVSFYTHVRKHRYSWAGLMHNLRIQISNTVVSTEGVCGSRAGRSQVKYTDSLFYKAELESLCKICGNSRICQELKKVPVDVPETNTIDSVTPEKACKNAGLICKYVGALVRQNGVCVL